MVCYVHLYIGQKWLQHRPEGKEFEVRRVSLHEVILDVYNTVQVGLGMTGKFHTLYGQI